MRISKTVEGIVRGTVVSIRRFFISVDSSSSAADFNIVQVREKTYKVI
jgi:hypothetical protein